MYTEIKYLNLLSTRLEKFKHKKDLLWNFRCPICGDSQKNRNKARGFVFQLKGKLLYKCHNCQVSWPFDKLLETLDQQLYKEYKMEKFKDNNPQKVDMRKVKRIVSKAPVFQIDVLSKLTPLDNLNNSHPAKEYILNRKLPTEALYYTEKFAEYVNSVKPDTFQESDQDEGRIIIPFKDKEGNTFGFQGRSVHSSGLRYVTILLEEKEKIFGLNTLNYDETIYITEGPFDSLLLQNACAMGGADIPNYSDLLGDNVVFIYDNEPRNVQIGARIKKHIQLGESVVIWPSEIKVKDINDMVLEGYEVQQIIDNNTYSGLTATLKFNEWRK